MLSGSELTEVFGSLGNNIIEELEDDATARLVVDRDIKLDVYQIPIAGRCPSNQDIRRR